LHRPQARAKAHSHRIPGSPAASALTSVTSLNKGPSGVVMRTSTSTSNLNSNSSENAALLKANAGLRDKCAQLEVGPTQLNSQKETVYLFVIVYILSRGDWSGLNPSFLLSLYL
jgi:hypothetical protein